jgi:hypothetical protein
MSEPTYTAEQTSACNLGESVAKIKIKVTYVDQKGAKPILNLVSQFMQMLTEWPNAQLDLLNNKIDMIGPTKAEREAALAAGAGDGSELAGQEKAKKSKQAKETKSDKTAETKTTKPKKKKPGAGLPTTRNQSPAK